MSMKLDFNNNDLLEMYNNAHARANEICITAYRRDSMRWKNVVGTIIKNTMESIGLQNMARLTGQDRSFRICISFDRLMDGHERHTTSLISREKLISWFVNEFNASNGPVFVAHEYKQEDGEVGISVEWYLPQERK